MEDLNILPNRFLPDFYSLSNFSINEHILCSMIEHLIKQLIILSTPIKIINEIFQFIHLQYENIISEDFIKSINLLIPKNDKEQTNINKDKIEKLFSVFFKKNILNSGHFEFILSQLSDNNNDNDNNNLNIFSKEEIQEEIDCILGLEDISYSFNDINQTKQILNTIINIEENVFQEIFNISITIEFIIPNNYPKEFPEFCIIESKNLTQWDINCLGYIMNHMEYRGPYYIFNTLTIINSCIHSYLKTKVNNEKQKYNQELVIPYLPPLNVLHTLHIQCKNMLLESYSLNLVQESMIKLIKKDLHESLAYKILQIENILQVEHYKTFINKLTEYNNRKDDVAAVTFGYHGASRNTIENIVDEGLLCAGEFTSKGYFIDVCNGSLYGEGIYLSPKINKAINYSYGYKDGIKQLIVSLVSLGKPFQCPNPLFFYDKNGYLITPPFNNGECKEGYDSHIAPKLNEYVIFNNEQLLPILLITIGPYGTKSKKQHQKTEENMKLTISKKPKPIKKKLSIIEKLDYKNCHLDFIRIPGTKDKYLIKLPLSHISKYSLFPEKKTYIHTIMMLDKSNSMGKTFHNRLIPSCKALYDSIRPNSADIICFGKTIDKYPIKNTSFFSSNSIKSIQLENATNILGGYSTAIDLALKRKNSILKNNNDIQGNNLIFIMILFSDGKDTINSIEKQEKIINNNNHYITANKLNIIFKVVGIGKKSDTKLGMKLKLSSETITIWRDIKPIYYARKPSNLLCICSELSKEIELMLYSYKSILLEIYNTSPFNGFINSFISPPVCTSNIQISDDTCGILYQGIPPREIIFNGFQITRLVVTEIAEHDTIVILNLISKLILDIKIAALTNKDTSSAINTLKNIIKAIKIYFFDKHELLSLNPFERAQLMKKQKSLVHDLEKELNGLTETVLLSKNKMNSDQQALWLTSTNNMKFGGKALLRVEKLQSSVTSDSIINDLRYICKNYKYNDSIVYDNMNTSILSLKTIKEHWSDIFSFISNDNLLELSISDYLYSFGCIGYAIHVTRTESSNINPWTLVVDYVSNQIIDSSSAMCLLDAGIPFEDNLNNEAGDVLIIPEPYNPEPYEIYLNSKLHNSYLAVVFTRNPSLSLPGQQISLVMISFVKAIEQLMNPTLRTYDHIKGILHMYVYIRNHIQKYSYWTQVLSKLFISNPGLHMTESEGDDVISVVKILAPMCCSDISYDLFIKNDLKHQLSCVALALLAEVTSRSCRVLIKSKGIYNAVSDIVCKALDISEKNTKIPDWKTPKECNIESITISKEYNSLRGKKYSGRLFLKKWTNCSPQAVVACLGFTNLLANYSDRSNIIPNICDNNQTNITSLIEYIQEGFNNITMKNFILQYVPNVNPVDLQIALYIQGLYNHSSKERKKGLPSLLQPKKVIEDIVIKERKNIILSVIKARFSHMKKELDLLQVKQKQLEFLNQHNGCPKLFSYKEIDKLNINRPKDDQLEVLDESGLLKHHCCFPSCPKYLQNLATKEDKQNNTRHGLFKHLSLFMYPQRFYIPNFHILCKTKYTSCSSETIFIQQILSILQKRKEEQAKFWKKVSQNEFNTYYTSLLHLYWQNQQSK